MDGSLTSGHYHSFYLLPDRTRQSQDPSHNAQLLQPSAPCWKAVLTRRTQPHQPPPQAPPIALVINLKRNPERLAKFKERYARSDFAAVALQRLDAVEGRAVEWSKYLTPPALQQLLATEQQGYRTSDPELTPGSVGCYLSMLEAWRRIMGTGAPYGFVFEDDATISENALARFAVALKQVPDDWDVILLGASAFGSLVGKDSVRIDKFLRLHGYAISVKGARRLYNTMLPMTTHVDWELSNRIPTGGARVYAVYPDAVWFEWQGTDIHVDVRADGQEMTQASLP